MLSFFSFLQSWVRRVVVRVFRTLATKRSKEEDKEAAKDKPISQTASVALSGPEQGKD